MECDASLLIETHNEREDVLDQSFNHTNCGKKLMRNQVHNTGGQSVRPYILSNIQFEKSN